MQVDLTIRRGTIVDGSGSEPYEGDVAIANGSIVAVGKNLRMRGVEEIDANGQLVTPGFVDIHTHYDGQVTWSNRITPSSYHGVTTVLMGNCGVGFAPCRPGDRDRLVHLMEGVEDLPQVVLAEGLPWNWETFPEYLDAIATRSFDVDVATQVPHSALRVYVMGERASERESATADDRKLMAVLAREAILAGALGFATSRTINHKGSDGRMVPTLRAAEAELTEVAMALASVGRGVMQLVSDFTDVAEEVAILRHVCEKSRRPLSITLPVKQGSSWREVLRWIEKCNADGLEVRAQVMGRASGLLSGFEMGYNPFYTTPTFMHLKALPQQERFRALCQPQIKARIIREEPGTENFLIANYLRCWNGMYVLGERPNYEPDPKDNVADLAARRGLAPEEFAYDAMLEHGGLGTLYTPVSFFVDGSLDVAGELLRHPNTVYGLGDGGAHVGMACDASVPTFLLQHWARERMRGRIPISEVVRGLTHNTARAVGLNDRGLLRPGYRADLNVIDFDRLELGPPRIRRDLPAHGVRIVQEATGYTATIVRGTVTYRNGVATEALPGRLVRGPQLPAAV